MIALDKYGQKENVYFDKCTHPLKGKKNHFGIC